MRFALVLLLLALLLVPLAAHAQEPTDQPAPTIEAQPPAPAANAATGTVDWLATLFGVWGSWSLTVFGFLEAAKKQGAHILGLFGLDGLPQLKSPFMVLCVVIAAYLSVQTGHLNAFDGAPAWANNLNERFQTLFTIAFLASGAFLLHDATKKFGAINQTEVAG